MDWRIKGVIQKALCAVPGGVRINDLLQRTVGGLRHFDVSVAGKVDDWVIHMDHMRTIDMPIAGKRVFEIGTGWFPTLPLCYALAGAGSCVTVDLNPHLSSRLSFRLLRALGEHLDVIAKAAGCSPCRVNQILRSARLHPEIRNAILGLSSRKAKKCFPERLLRKWTPLSQEEQLSQYRTYFP